MVRAHAVPTGTTHIGGPFARSFGLWYLVEAIAARVLFFGVRLLLCWRRLRVDISRATLVLQDGICFSQRGAEDAAIFVPIPYMKRAPVVLS